MSNDAITQGPNKGIARSSPVLHAKVPILELFLFVYVYNNSWDRSIG